MKVTLVSQERKRGGERDQWMRERGNAEIGGEGSMREERGTGEREGGGAARTFDLSRIVHRFWGRCRLPGLSRGIQCLLYLARLLNGTLYVSHMSVLK